jgi:hypothetical protein
MVVSKQKQKGIENYIYICGEGIRILNYEHLPSLQSNDKFLSRCHWTFVKIKLFLWWVNDSYYYLLLMELFSHTPPDKTI